MKDEYDFRGGVRGPVVPPEPGTTRVTLRLDDEVLDWLRDQVETACGGDYTRLINAALRDHITDRETLEQMLRRVVREELQAAGLQRAAGGALDGSDTQSS